MKKNFILLVLFFFCLKLLAFTSPATIKRAHFARNIDTIRKDTVKVLNEWHGDSIKTLTSSINSSSLRLFASASHRDSLRALALINNSDSLKIFSSLKRHDAMMINGNPKDSINLLFLTQRSDSLMLADGSRAVDSLGRPINADSLANVAFLMRIDTFRSPIYIHLLDSLKQRLRTMRMDSLKQELQITTSDLFKAPIYTAIASRYADYDTLSNKRTRAYYQFESLNYTMLALHKYSLYNDTLGLRSCFENLSKVYLSQGKLSQAKWFMIQSNTLSRAKKEYPEVISSLVKLAAIKSDIAEYKLAMRDLNEALQISVAHHLPRSQSLVLKSFGLLYSRMQNYDKEAVVLKKRDAIEEALRKEEEAQLLAKDIRQNKKLDSLQTKRKVYSSNIKKSAKAAPVKKTVSL